MSGGDPFIQYEGPERRQDDAGLARELGGLQARMKAVEDAYRSQSADIKAILTTLNEAKGGWKALMIVGGISGAVGALAAKLLPFIPMK